jgi:excisionase family DNA binding protein
MQGIIITIEKDELEDIISKAVETALIQTGFVREQVNDSNDLNDLVMRSADVCKYLKMKISTLYQLTHRNEIPCSKKGKTLYFKKDEIDKWVSEGKQLTKYEHNFAREIAISVADKKRNKNIA